MSVLTIVLSRSPSEGHHSDIEIQYAVNYDNPEIARFLLGVGANRDVEDLEQAYVVNSAQLL